MSLIKSVHALEILDSRGNPTIEVFVTTDDGFVGKAKVPSGASRGENEACELRDEDKKRYFGKGVKKCVSNVNGPLARLIIGKSVFEQSLIDKILIDADGSENKSLFGANAILGISLAVARAAASASKKSLFRYLSKAKEYNLPCPMINVINGGVHADSGLAFQEFMIRPVGAKTFSEAVRYGAEVFHTLKNILKEKKHSVSVGDEGGFAPQLKSNEEALDFIVEAIDRAGYKAGSQISIALDCAASEFFDKKNEKYLRKTREKYIDDLTKLIASYPISSIEDPLDQNDWDGWAAFTKAQGKIQIVGDDIFVTNKKFLEKGIKLNVANAILVKPNQIGTLTETFETIDIAKKAGYATIISHRSGETEDTTIADIAVAVNALQIKTGSMCRGERTSKYNRLLEIEDELLNASFATKDL